MSTLSPSLIDTTFSSKIATADTNISTSITNMGTNPTTQELLAIQRQIQLWSMLVDLQSTLTKSTVDTMKSVIQKT